MKLIIGLMVTFVSIGARAEVLAEQDNLQNSQAVSLQTKDADQVGSQYSVDLSAMRRRTTSFNWIGADCAEFTPHGILIRYVYNDHCRARRGSVIKWSGSECAEFTPNSVLVRYVYNDLCRGRQGSVIKWSGSECAEFTPHGILIRYVYADRCRARQGSVIKWSGADCAEFTRKGNALIRYVNRNLCRYR